MTSSPRASVFPSVTPTQARGLSALLKPEPPTPPRAGLCGLLRGGAGVRGVLRALRLLGGRPWGFSRLGRRKGKRRCGTSPTPRGAQPLHPYFLHSVVVGSGTPALVSSGFTVRLVLSSSSSG